MATVADSRIPQKISCTVYQGARRIIDDTGSFVRTGAQSPRTASFSQSPYWTTTGLSRPSRSFARDRRGVGLARAQPRGRVERGAHEREHEERRDEHDGIVKRTRRMRKFSTVPRPGPGPPGSSLSLELPSVHVPEHRRDRVVAQVAEILLLQSAMFGSGSSGSDTCFWAMNWSALGLALMRDASSSARSTVWSNGSNAGCWWVEFWPDWSFALFGTFPSKDCAQRPGIEVRVRLAEDRELVVALHGRCVPNSRSALWFLIFRSMPAAFSCSCRICSVSSRRWLPAVVTTVRLSFFPFFA